MSETYETIGIAVRQHDAIRLSILKGEPTTFFIDANSVDNLFDRRTVDIFRLRLTGDYITPEPTGNASMSMSGKTVLVRIAGTEYPMLIPTRQLQVHYDRNMGETAKIMRRVEAEARSPTFATPARMAEV